jgi:hypothetical protein
MKNVGEIDRFVRAILGLALIVLPFALGASLFANPFLFWGSIAVGVVLVGTATLSFCPIYAALGLSSRRRGQS